MTPQDEITMMLMHFHNGMYNTKDGLAKDAEGLMKKIVALCQPPKINIIKRADLVERLGDGTASETVE